MADYLVIDNFLDKETLATLHNCFESLRFYDLSSISPIRGHRTKKLNSRFTKRDTAKACKKVIEDLRLLESIPKESGFRLYLHKICKEHLEAGYSLEKDAWHTDTDGCKYAGIVYLNKYPELNTGTLLHINGERITFDNKFNRLVMYDASILHRVEGITDTPRLTLNIFLQ